MVMTVHKMFFSRTLIDDISTRVNLHACSNNAWRAFDGIIRTLSLSTSCGTQGGSPTPPAYSFTLAQPTQGIKEIWLWGSVAGLTGVAVGLHTSRDLTHTMQACTLRGRGKGSLSALVKFDCSAVGADTAYQFVHVRTTARDIVFQEVQVLVDNGALAG